MLRRKLKNRLKGLLGREESAAAPETPRPAPVRPEPPRTPEPALQAATPARSTAPVGGFAALATAAAQGDLEEARHADQSSTDLEAYRERMRANGREVELASEGLNTSKDGARFVGPVDNESSRAKAEGRVLTIDQHECISCGTCVEQTADVFFLPEGAEEGGESKAEVLKQEGAMDLIQDAVDACPVTCIHWVDADALHEEHSYGGFDPGR